MSELRRSYRTFRRSIIMLPQLESSVMADLRTIDELINEDRDYPALFEWGVEILQSAREYVEETHDAFEAIWEEGSKSSVVRDGNVFRQILNKTVTEEETRNAILQFVQYSGGLEEMFEVERDRLRVKLAVYTEVSKIAEKANPKSFSQALERLIEYYAEREKLKEEWRQKLRDAAREDEERAKKDTPYFPSYPWVLYDLCQEYPDIALELGVDCTKVGHPMGSDSCLCFGWPGVLLCIIIVIAVVAMEHD